MLYILNTGQITQLMKLGANEVEVAGSFSKRVLFWVLSSVDPMRRISTSWLKRPRGLLSFMFSHWKKLALNVPRGTDKGGNIRRCRWPWEHSPVPTVSRTDQSQASLAGLLMNVERKHSRLHERTPPPPPCLPAVPSSVDRVGALMLFCKMIRIMLKGQPASYVTVYIVTTFSEH